MYVILFIIRQPLKAVQIANFSQITHSPTFGRGIVFTHGELSVKVLQIANFSQITHSPTFGRAFTL